MTDIVSRTLSIHQEHELLGALERAGLSREDAQSLIQSPSGRLAKSVVNHIRWSGILNFSPPTESQQIAQKIMGDNFLGLSEVANHFAIVLSKEEAAPFAEVPFPARVLEECRDSHALVADFGFFTNKIRDLAHRTFAPRGEWHSSGGEEPGWRLVRKGIIPESMQKNWEAQIELLGATEQVPSYRTLVYMLVLFYLARGKWLLEGVYARTIDTNRNNWFRELRRFCVSTVNDDDLPDGAFPKEQGRKGIFGDLIPDSATKQEGANTRMDTIRGSVFDRSYREPVTIETLRYPGEIGLASEWKR